MPAYTDLLLDQRAEKRLLLVAEPLVSGVATPLYLSTHGFVSQPTDTPANQFYAPRVTNGYGFQRSLYEEGRLSGRSLPGAGTIELNNADGGLDYLAPYAWGGARVRVYLGGKGFLLSEFGLIFDGTAQGLSWSDTTITINLRDLGHVFDREIQTKEFVTAEIGPGNELAGKLKPIALGACRLIEPVYVGVVNGKETFIFESDPSIGVVALWDRGVGLTYAANPAPGEYSVNLPTSTITLGGSFQGPIRATVIGRRHKTSTSTSSVTLPVGATATFVLANAAEFRTDEWVRVVLNGDAAGFWVDGQITAITGNSVTLSVLRQQGTGTFANWSMFAWGTVADLAKEVARLCGVTALNTTAMNNVANAEKSATMGYWIPEGGNAGEILDEIVNGAGCYWGFNRSGLFEVEKVKFTTSILTLTQQHIISIGREPIEDPSYRVTVRYARNWDPMSLDQIAGAVPNKPSFTLEYYEVSAGSTAPTNYPLSQPLVVDSLYFFVGNANFEAGRQHALFSVYRDYFKVLTKSPAMQINLNDTITIVHSRYGLKAGKEMIVVDIAETFDDGVLQVELGLWG